MFDGELELGFDSGGDENGRWTCVRRGTLADSRCWMVSWTWVFIVVVTRMLGGLELG
jgi:hypothetical protein